MDTKKKPNYSILKPFTLQIKLVLSSFKPLLSFPDLKTLIEATINIIYTQTTQRVIQISLL